MTNETTKTETAISESADLGRADARYGREPLWYRVGDSYVSAETGRIGNPALAATYLAAYTAELPA